MNQRKSTKVDYCQKVSSRGMINKGPASQNSGNRHECISEAGTTRTQPDHIIEGFSSSAQRRPNQKPGQQTGQNGGRFQKGKMKQPGSRARVTKAQVSLAKFRMVVSSVASSALPSAAFTGKDGAPSPNIR